MSELQVTSLSTKGQVVIPRSVRERLGLKPGAKMIVMSDGQNVLLKPLEAPMLDSFKRLIRESRAYARRAGLEKSDLANAIRKVRNAHRD
jgi:AbrB family looped-hinge helix DNA binding protein